MDEAFTKDPNRTVKGKPYQLLLFEHNYEPHMYDLNAVDEDKDAVVAHVESKTPFLPIHVGDILDGRTLGFDLAVRFKVERIEHQIDVNHGLTRHRMVLFVSNWYPDEPQTTRIKLDKKRS